MEKQVSDMYHGYLFLEITFYIKILTKNFIVNFCFVKQHHKQLLVITFGQKLQYRN